MKTYGMQLIQCLIKKIIAEKFILKKKKNNGILKKSKTREEG